MKRYFYEHTTQYRQVEQNTQVEVLPDEKGECHRCGGRGQTPRGGACFRCKGEGRATVAQRVRVSYRAALPLDSPADSDPSSMPLLIDGIELGAYEMRLLAVKLWKLSFTEEAIPATPDRPWLAEAAISARNDLVDRFISTATDVMEASWYEGRRGDSSGWDDYTGRVVQAVTSNHFGNMHINRFVGAMADARLLGEAAGEES